MDDPWTCSTMIASFAAQHPDPEVLGEIAAADGDRRFRVERSRTGLMVPAAAIDGGIRGLRSRVDPLKETKRLLGAIDDAELYVVLGATDPELVVALASRPRCAQVLVVDTAGLYRSLYAPGQPGAASTSRRVASCGDTTQVGAVRVCTPQTFPTVWRRHVSAAVTRFGLVPLAARVRLDDPLFRSVREVFLELRSQIAWDRATQKRFGRSWFRNTIVNLAATEGRTRRMRVRGDVVVVAAGPGLNLETLSWVAASASSAPVFACDTAWPLLRSDAVLVGMDAQPYAALHVVGSAPHLLLADLAYSPTVTRMVERIAFVSSSHPLHRALCGMIGADAPPAVSSSNVGEGAVRAALALGAKRVFVVGWDLANDGPRTYARGTYLDGYIDRRRTRLFPGGAPPAAPPAAAGRRGWWRDDRLAFYRTAVDDLLGDERVIPVGGSSAYPAGSVRPEGIVIDEAGARNGGLPLLESLREIIAAPSDTSRTILLPLTISLQPSERFPVADDHAASRAYALAVLNRVLRTCRS